MKYILIILFAASAMGLFQEQNYGLGIDQQDQELIWIQNQFTEVYAAPQEVLNLTLSYQGRDPNVKITSVRTILKYVSW